MRNESKAVDCWCSHTAVYQQGVVVTDERKADDADCLKESRLNDRESLLWVALEFLG